ncbi:hypothetical protein N431DRAFT_440274 [Stipitochalara longipes BDJ]|nr:hypothetical protein N431DRAFT_440274 [Stipitochalara longipes BDJ]
MSFDAFTKARNLGVGIEPRRSQSRACIGAACVGAMQSKVVPPIQRPLASWCSVRRQAMRQAGKHSRSPAESNSAPDSSLLALWVVARQSLPWGMACALVRADGRWALGTGLRVWRENSGIRCISILIYGKFYVLGESHAERVSVGLRIWAAAGVLHPHRHAIAQEQHGEGDGAPITRPDHLSPTCSNGAPASRLNMQAECSKNATASKFEFAAAARSFATGHCGHDSLGSGVCVGVGDGGDVVSWRGRTFGGEDESEGSAAAHELPVPSSKLQARSSKRPHLLWPASGSGVAADAHRSSQRGVLGSGGLLSISLPFTSSLHAPAKKTLPLPPRPSH